WRLSWSPGNGQCHSPSRQPVVTRAVVPEDRALRGVGQRELQEALDAARILAVGVREVGGEHDVVDADQIEDALDRLLVTLDRDVALTLEVGAVPHREL